MQQLLGKRSEKQPCGHQDQCRRRAGGAQGTGEFSIEREFSLSRSGLKSGLTESDWTSLQKMCPAQGEYSPKWKKKQNG